MTKDSERTEWIERLETQLINMHLLRVSLKNGQMTVITRTVVVSAADAEIDEHGVVAGANSAVASNDADGGGNEMSVAAPMGMCDGSAFGDKGTSSALTCGTLLRWYFRSSHPVTFCVEFTPATASSDGGGVHPRGSTIRRTSTMPTVVVPPLTLERAFEKGTFGGFLILFAFFFFSHIDTSANVTLLYTITIVTLQPRMTPAPIASSGGTLVASVRSRRAAMVCMSTIASGRARRNSTLRPYECSMHMKCTTKKGPREIQRRN